MKKLILRFGWVRSLAAALTAAGVAVVFVVLIVPTAFGSSKAAKGGCGISITKISTDKEFLSAAEDPADESYVVAIFGSKLNRDPGDQVDVYFGGPSGKEWILGSATFVDEGGGYLLATPEPESVGVPGRIKVSATQSAGGSCYAISNGTFTPKNAGTDS